MSALLIAPPGTDSCPSLPTTSISWRGVVARVSILLLGERWRAENTYAHSRCAVDPLPNLVLRLGLSTTRRRPSCVHHPASVLALHAQSSNTVRITPFAFLVGNHTPLAARYLAPLRVVLPTHVWHIPASACGANTSATPWFTVTYATRGATRGATHPPIPNPPVLLDGGVQRNEPRPVSGIPSCAIATLEDPSTLSIPSLVCDSSVM